MDRGKKGLEVFLLLLSCMLAFPGGVFLNRGNHEDLIMNSRLVNLFRVILFCLEFNFDAHGFMCTEVLLVSFMC